MAQVSSGAHRLTGMGLVGGLGLFGIGALCCDVTPAIECIKNNALLLYPMKFIVSYCVLYHTIAGYRHIAYEFFPDSLTMKGILATSNGLYFGLMLVALGLTFYKIKAKKTQKKEEAVVAIAK